MTTGILDQLDALADRTRSRIMLLLTRQELTVTELHTVLQLPQSTVSRQLKTLAEAGLVAMRVDGTTRWYRAEVDSFSSGTARVWQAVSEDLNQAEAAGQDLHRLEAVLASRRSTSRAYFAETAGEWDRVREELFGNAVSIGALLGLVDSDWCVADLGCGTGFLSALLAQSVARVVAIDDSTEMLNAAADRMKAAGHDNVELRRGTLEQLPVEPNSLDLAFLVLVLHHVVDPAEVVARTGEALKPGGRLIVVDMMPHDRTEYRQQMGHVWQGFSQAQVSNWWHEAGLREMQYRAVPPDPQAAGPVLFAAAATKSRAGSVN